MRLPFGRFRGKRLEELPGWYLEWVLQQKIVDPELRRALAEEQIRRFGLVRSGR